MWNHCLNVNYVIASIIGNGVGLNLSFNIYIFMYYISLQYLANYVEVIEEKKHNLKLQYFILSL